MVEAEPFVVLLVGWMLLYGVVVYALHRRRGADDDGPDAAPTPVPQSNSSGARSRSADAGGSVSCRLCGTENDPEFTYCRSCVAELGTPRTRPR